MSFDFDSLRRLGASVALVMAAAWLSGCASVAPPVAEPAEPPPPVAAPAPPPAPPVAVAPAKVATPAPPVARIQLDPVPDNARVSLWQRIRDGYAIPDLDDDLVRRWERHYAERPDYVQRMTARGARYLFHIVEEVERRGLPLDLALLPFIESAFNPQALSSARAAGMWQFMPATGRDFDLRQNLFRDDRRDVLASTRAALDYLSMLYQQFGDWHLALAAYNWGQGNVQRAVRRNEAAGRPTDYASLRMPAETRNYVPKLQAVKNIVARPQDFALALTPLENHPFFVAVPITQDIDVALVTRLSGVTPEDFLSLNPQFNKPVILAAGTPQVLLPYDNANLFVRGLEAHDGPLATWTAWVAPKTLKPQEAARLVGIDEQELREINRIPPRMLVKAGSTLLVPRPRHATANVAEHIADHAAIALAPESPAKRLRKVKAGRRGDTVVALARRHGMQPAELARLNGVTTSARFKPGQVVQVVQALPAATRAATPARKGRKMLARADAPRVSKQASASKASRAPTRTAAAPAPAVR